MSDFPGLGYTYEVDAGARVFHDRYDPDGTLTFKVVSGAGAPRTETVPVVIEHVSGNIWITGWQEASGQTILHVNDFDGNKVHVYVTTADGQFRNVVATLTRLD